jgi:heme-degrading monooxygenase HmoA
MPETYTSGLWVVKESKEQDFVAAWTDFVTWAKDQPGSGKFRLVRDTEDPRSFLSFAPWASFDDQKAWKQTDEFRARMKRVQEHVERFEPSTYELVTEVG